MKSVLFIQSHTLYAKSTLPVAFELIKKGYKVFFKSNSFSISKKSNSQLINHIKNNPINVNIINKNSLKYIAKILDMEHVWSKYQSLIFIDSYISFRKFNLVIGTIKDMSILKKYASNKNKTIALGYQHFPVFINLNKKHNINYDSNFFLQKNNFTKYHNFEEVLLNYSAIQSSFTYLDYVYNKKIKVTKNSDHVLIFHPGGYRNILSRYGDNQTKSYIAQSNFVEKICIPLIKKKIKPIIKIHPLSAIFHDFSDMNFIIKEVLLKNNFNVSDIKLISRDEPYWKYAHNSKFILTFGSSSIYELWSIGLKNVFVCNFFGDSRSKKFKFFNSIFIDNYNSYTKLINEFNDEDINFDEFSNMVFNSYYSLYKGNSLENLMNFINES